MSHGSRFADDPAMAGQVRAVLLKLARPRRALMPMDRGGREQAEFAVVSDGGAQAKAGFSVGADTVDLLLRNDLIQPDKAGLIISPAGRAWLRRQLAGADPFREQHQARAIRLIDMGGGVRRPAVVDDAESPLAWLRQRKDKSGRPMIDDAQYQAGERLRADFFRAGMTPRITSSWDAGPGNTNRRRGAPGAGVELRDTTIAARQRVNAAMQAVGPDLADVLFDVCCHLKGLEEAEKAKGWPRRSGKVVLQIALTRLARHYGLIGTAGSDVQERRRLVHWGASDYRPRM